MKIAVRIHIILCYLSLPYLLLWYFFAGMNAIRAGYYPYYPDHPDIFLFGSKPFLEVMDFFLVIAFFSIPVWVVYSLTLSLFGNYQLRRRHEIGFLILSIVLVFHFLVDPAFAWYLD